MKNLIVGNWKLYVNTPAEGKKLLRGIDKGLPRQLKSDIVVCPQISLAPLLRSGYGGKRIAFGTQDMYVEESGSYTGAVSPASLVSSGLKYVIVGHAERRAEGDTDETVSKKAALAIQMKLHPIICVGEPVRDAEGGHFSYLAQNVLASLSHIAPSEKARFTIAYDPLWAIGAEEPPASRLVSEAIIYIRKTLADTWGRDAALKVRIIYGGSVTPESAAGFKAEKQVQGFLVGRASVDPKKFTDIIRAFS